MTLYSLLRQHNPGLIFVANRVGIDSEQVTHSKRPKIFRTAHDAALSADERLNFAVELATWRRATARCSSPSELVAHAASVKLMSYPKAERCMVESLSREPSLLVFLLQKMTGARPYDSLEAGDIVGMSERWVDWYWRRSANEA